MKVIFMGTSGFAVPALETIAASYDVPLVITQPDRPSGRGMEVHQSPVKQAAIRLGIPVFQPEKIRMEDSIEYLRSYLPVDAMVVAAFGQIIPKVILEMPRLGCVNVHASLLPKYRGAAPIQHAIINGETVTGVTTMLMDPGLDTGDILQMREIPIGNEDNAGTLTDKLAKLGAEMIVPTLEGLDNGTVKPVPQDHSQATEARSLKREAGELSLTRPATEIVNRVRGVSPRPGAYLVTSRGILKVHKASVVDCELTDRPVGCIVDIVDNEVVVATGDECLALQEVQPENRKRMSAVEYARGARLNVGDNLIGG